MNAVIIKHECNYNHLKCDYFIKEKTPSIIINIGQHRLKCKYERYGECHNQKAIKEASKVIDSWRNFK
jgi:hypothetical protein